MEENPEISALKAQLAKTQKQVEALTATTTQGCQHGAAGGADKRKRDGAKPGVQRTEFKLCSMCNNRHAGDPPEALCFKKDWDAEIRHATSMQKKKKEYEKRQKDAKDTALKAKVDFIESVNKSDEECIVSCLVWTPELALPASTFNPTMLDVQQGACVDSGSLVDITNATEQANLTHEPSVYLNGILDGVQKVDYAEVHFPTIDSNNRPVVIRTHWKGLFFKGATSKILLLALLLHSGHKVHFATG